MALQFHNSLTREKETFVPLAAGKVTMYTCGPTVYDFAHIGNFRAYVFEDLLHRVLRFKGYEVTQVMNLTDIDDKTIRNSIAQGIPLDEYTRKYKDAFFEDIKTLNITPCAVYPAATDHVPEMVDIIKKLLADGIAYEKDGSVYFGIDRFPAYGKLAHLEKQELVTGASGRVDSDEYDKENASDFVLWKGWTDKDGDVFWETELGKGRPGWHIECSAMSMKYLGETMDIHTGGVDNLFPHHENEIAQSEAFTGKPFVRTWLHCAYLVVGGEKMSKSKGNFFTLRDLLAKGYSAKALRYLLLSTHYRKMLNFSEEGVEASATALARLQQFIQDLLACDADGASNAKLPAVVDGLLTGFETALDDDLNIAEALAVLFPWTKQVRELFPLSKADASKALDALKRIDEVLGVLDFEPAAPVSLDEQVAALIEKRKEARAAKDFAASDRIRDELAAMGIVLKDTPQGVTWERKN